MREGGKEEREMAASNCRRCGFIYSQGQCQLLTVNLNGGDELFFSPSNGNLIEMHGCCSFREEWETA